MTRFLKQCLQTCGLAALIAIVCLFPAQVFAEGEQTEMQSFESEQQRELFHSLTEELRCPKCQNQNISDSNSQISIDLRNQVARLVRENQTEEQIKEYMVNRYGEFVLYEPPLNKGTLLLWFGPLIMAVLGVLIFVLSVMARKKNIEAEAKPDHTSSDGSNDGSPV